MALLVENGAVIPGDVEASLLIQRMRNHPPAATNMLQAPPELIERVSAFIESLCPSDAENCTVELERDGRAQPQP